MTTEQHNFILVDSSVWVEYFRRQESVFEHINFLVEQKRAATIELVLAELIQGAITRKEIDIIRDLADAIPILPEKQDTWEKAAILSFEMRRKGVTVGLTDCYIAVLSKSHQAKLFSFDNHFKIISKHYPLQTYIPIN